MVSLLSGLTLSMSAWIGFGVVPVPKVSVSHVFLSVVAWAMVVAGRSVMEVARAEGSNAAMRMRDRAVMLTKAIVSRRWRILRAN